MLKHWIIGLARQLSMKTPNCIKTGLMAAFRAQGVYPGIRWTDTIAETSANQ
jgi:hypothetical protein